jgi:predicted nucleic acid-binding protein
MILVDTSVWIDYLRGEDSPCCKTLRTLIEQEEDLSLTGIIITEILQGIRDDKSSSEVRQYLLGFPLYDPHGTFTYIRAADIFKSCAKQGKTVRKTIDCLIAAIAIENGLVLLHNDRDFDSIAACTELKTLSLPE